MDDVQKVSNCQNPLIFFIQKIEAHETVTLSVFLYGHETGSLTLKEEQNQSV
jgi:hypothetical protein